MMTPSILVKLEFKFICKSIFDLSWVRKDLLSSDSVIRFAVNNSKHKYVRKYESFAYVVMDDP